MMSTNHHPFKQQYHELQITLDYLQPYLPFLSSDRAKDFLLKVARIDSDEEIQQLKEEYILKLRMDFIHAIYHITDENDWHCLINTCEKIRSRKEEVYLH